MAGSDSEDRGRIFISYRRQETAYPAGWLFEHLAAEYGAEQIFKDVDSIHLGDDFVERISAAVASCDVLLALIGHQWLTILGEDGRPRIEDPKDFVRLEIEAALARDVLVIPVLVDGATMPHESQLPPSLAPLARRQALELSPAQFDFDTSRLLSSLEESLAGATQTERSTHALSGHPSRTKPHPSRSRNFIVAGGAAGVLIVVALVIVVFALGSGSNSEPSAGPNRNVVFEDDFSSTSSGWDDTNGPGTGGHYTDGNYRLVGEWSSDLWSESSFPRNEAAVFPNAPEDVRVSVVGRRLRGRRDGAYGIVCRADPGVPSYYQFAIWPGSAVIEKFVPVGASYYQLASTDLAAVHQNGENRMAATCTTDGAGHVRLEFAVNGRTVASAVDTGAQLAPPLLTGTVGLVIAKGSEDADPIEAEFDDFSVAAASAG